MTSKTDFSDEIKALEVILNALGQLNDDQKKFVFKTAGERLGLAVASTRESGNRERPDGSGDGDEADDNVSPKEFLKAKQPKTDVERVVCLAYYLTHYRDTTNFKTQEISALNTEAAQTKFSNAATSVKNATIQNRYLASAGKGGMKQISALGEDVVKALPNQEEVKKVVAAARKPRKKKNSKGSSDKK